MFTATTLFLALMTFFILSFHRFWATHPEAAKNLLIVPLFQSYFRWLKRRCQEICRNVTVKKIIQLTSYLPFWKFRDLEKWLFVAFYLSYIYLGSSGLFFAIFIKRGLYGFPLLLHVLAGGVFGFSLTVIVISRGRYYVDIPKPIVLSVSLLDPRRLGITLLRVQYFAFWLFVVSGFFLIISALLPMLPLLNYSGQRLMFETHRVSALVSVVSGIVFADLEFFLKQPARKSS